METILAVMLATAVILFGTLISLGNERQRKAIDGLREQVFLWAVQDLKIKREHLVRTVQVPDPLDWLNKITSKIRGYDLQLQIIETFATPPALVCTSAYDNTKIVFSPLSPVELRGIKRSRRNRLFQFAEHNPLLSLPRNFEVRELSLLNEGHLFDLEMALTWKVLTGQNLESSNQFWMYEFSE